MILTYSLFFIAVLSKLAIFEIFDYFGTGGIGGYLNNATQSTTFNNTGNGGIGGDIYGNQRGYNGKSGVVILYFNFNLSKQ